MDEINEEHLDSLPQFERAAIIDCHKLDQMQRFCYEMITPTVHHNEDEVDAMWSTIKTLRRGGHPYVLTVEINGNGRTFHLWVSGVEKRIDRAMDNKSTRLSGVNNAG